MTRITPFVLLLLAGCANDFTIQVLPPEVPQREAPAGPTLPPFGGSTDPLRPPQPPGNGPWGSLNPGDLPEIYFAVAYSDQACEDVDGDGADPGEDPGLEGDVLVGDEGEDVDEPPGGDEDSWYECPSRLAVIDLMGQVIAEFPLPGETDSWTPWSYLALSAAGPGQFLAVMESYDTADGDGADGFWQGRPWHALLGDAVTGQLETIAQWDLATSQVRMTATGELIDLGSWNAFANLAVAPTMPDRLMMWSGTTNCSEMQSLRAAHIPGLEEDLVWTGAELLPPDLLPEDGGKPRLWPWNLDGGYDFDGTSRLLLGVTDDGCGDSPGTYELVAWSPEEGPLWHQPAAAQGWTWPPSASWAGHDGGAALELLWGYSPEQIARVITEDGVVEQLLPADPEIQMRHAGPMLDAAGPTFVTIGRRIQEFDSRDVLEIQHEGAVVWTIDGLRFGLAERAVFFQDVALLAPLPTDR
jgi:hypothetical protein